MLDKTKYVVLDVETNGLNSTKHDLLSISFYCPDNEYKYERYLPLELNDSLNPESKKINGIKYDRIKDCVPLSQDEWNKLVIDLDLKNREILHYGRIDESFLKNYFKRHNIKGFDSLKFHNIKRHFITDSFSQGQYSKDNLCNALDIKGVKRVHNGLKDCILEWQLFEKIEGGFVFCTMNGPYKIGLYKLTSDYYVPASRIRYYPNFRYAINLPEIKTEYDEVFSIELSDKCKTQSYFQPTGIATENLIRSLLQARDVDDELFSEKNFEKLKLIGEFVYNDTTHLIPIKENDDGTITAVNDEDSLFVEDMNRVMENIRCEIVPLIDYIKNKIFLNEEILNQELVIDDNIHAFGYTDFSNNNACIEMKFSNSLMIEQCYGDNHTLLDKHKYQFFILSKNRPMFILLGGDQKIKILKLKMFVGDEIDKLNITSRRIYKTKIVEQYSKDGLKIKEFNSVKDAGNELGISYRTIRDNCNGRIKYTKGFRFEYKK